jgi:hypothetical protein
MNALGVQNQLISRSFYAAHVAFASKMLAFRFYPFKA